MNTTSLTPAASVLAEVATWPGVTTQPTPRGATAVVFDGQELGHVHLNRRTLDLPLPADRRTQVLEAGHAKEWFSNWVTKQLASRTDARRQVDRSGDDIVWHGMTHRVSFLLHMNLRSRTLGVSCCRKRERSGR